MARLATRYVALRSLLLGLGLVACTSTPKGADSGADPTGTTGETGGTPEACDGFVGTPQTSTTSDPYADPCPGGGTIADLFATVRITSAADPTTPCEVCPAGPIAAEVHVVNLCDVGVDVEVACPVTDYTLTQPGGGELTLGTPCTAAATVVTLTDDTLWWTAEWDLTEPGAHQLVVALDGGLGTVETTFCVQ